jgi:hypothetical protein
MAMSVSRPVLLRALPLLLVLAGCTDAPTAAVREGAPGGPALLMSGTVLTWTAGAGTTDWHTAANWDAGVVPAPDDTVVIPAAAPLFPVLAANASVGGVEVEDGAELELDVFDLTASASVSAGATGGITGSDGGRLVLTGTGQTIRGTLPTLRVTGTYSLAADVTARTRVVVQLGRLRTSGFQLRVIPLF